eukprot:12856113-Alexandrium_andersonii.AAC.1
MAPPRLQYSARSPPRGKSYIPLLKSSRSTGRLGSKSSTSAEPFRTAPTNLRRWGKRATSASEAPS